ncbi:retrovirus-related pol polyprotein from transposon TNT 1-94 [Tanacetum coccineum]
MTTLADKSLLSGGDNKPPMLEKHLYDSWKSRMELYMMNRPHGRMILASVEKGPLVWPSITEDGVTRLKEYVELTPAEAIQADCDIKAINIILQGLPTEIYALVSQHRVAKDLWEKIKLLMQGTSLTKQERECKLYDEFDKFTYKKGETLHEYYLRFTLLLNDMNIYKMPLEQFQVNTKFLNTLPDEWSKFVTDVKLVKVKDLHTTNVDQLHAYLQQHERHANEVRLMHARNSDPLALVASHQLTQQKKRGQAPERNKAIQEEVEKLVDVGIMKEVHYHSWLSNPVMVKKHDGSWRMCVDFKDLNKACPQDGYPLPEIDWKTESLCGYPLKCFLDAYKGYHQIKMVEEDEEKTTFITSQRILCYSKMPFDLKNAGATYQRLVDRAFQKQIERNLEVYVDDLVIKSHMK